jgi:hypothetical protein
MHNTELAELSSTSFFGARGNPHPHLNEMGGHFITKKRNSVN